MPDNSHTHLDRSPGARAFGVLSRVANEPFPAQEITRPLVQKLLRFKFIRIEERKTPYKTQPAGTLIEYIVITDLGRQALESHKENRKVSRLLKGGL